MYVYQHNYNVIILLGTSYLKVQKTLGNYFEVKPSIISLIIVFVAISKACILRSIPQTIMAILG